jgi:hypothetical protein
MPKTSRNINSPSDGLEITPGTPFPACVAVNCASAGSGTVTWAGTGRTTTFYFTLGNNALQITNVSADGLTADGLVALYND